MKRAMTFKYSSRLRYVEEMSIISEQIQLAEEKDRRSLEKEYEKLADEFMRFDAEVSEG